MIDVSANGPALASQERPLSRLVNHGPGRGLWEFRPGDPVSNPASGRGGRLVALRERDGDVDMGDGRRPVTLPLASLIPDLPSRRLPAEVVEVHGAGGRVLLARQVLAGKGEAEAERLRQALTGQHGCVVRVRLIEAV